MDYLPSPEDLEELLPEIVSGRDLGEVAEALHTTRDSLERLLKSDPTAVSTMRDLQAEMEALISLRLLTMVPQALDTLQLVMSGRVNNSKLAMAMVRASESVMDRNRVAAKVSRGAPAQAQGEGASGGIKPLQELLEGVDSEDRMAVVDRYMAFFKEAEALREGNVLPRNVSPGEGDAGEVHRGKIQNVRVVEPEE